MYNYLYLVRRTRRRWLNPETEKLQSGKASCTSVETVCTVNKVVSLKHQVGASTTSGSRLESREAILPHVSHCDRANNASQDVKKIRTKKSSKSKQSLKSKRKDI